METVSIIIPVYNMEESLRDCIDSVLVQTHEDLQIILIDDGSTDNSGAVCDAYADNDRRIIVLHKENGGVSSARNVGIDNATGKYLMFIDADDRVTEDYVSNYVYAAEKEKAALVIGGATIIEDGNVTQHHVQCGILSQKELISQLCREGTETFGYVCAKMYDKSLIDQYDLRFDEEMTSQEDLDFFLSFLQSVSTVIFVEDYGYIYVKKPNERVLPIEHAIRNYCKLYTIGDTVGVSANDMDCLVRRLQAQLYVSLYHAESEREIAELYNAVEDKHLLLSLKKQHIEVKFILRLFLTQKHATILSYFRARKRLKQIQIIITSEKKQKGIE